MDEDLVERANARLGQLLRGKYTLTSVLGIGGMATVYAATHRNGKEFAVKVLHADLSLRSDTRTRFLREGYLANRVNHPGAVAVIDDDIAEDGGAFLVMELLHGQTVDAIWERNRFRLSLPLVVGVGLQLLDVLAAAHSRGLIHRDIKPANLMLTHDGAVKVLDFGIARLRDMTNVQATQTGMVMGTPAFMAPEHALAKTEEIDAQTDLWAVGATMFTLATGLLVHDADNTQQILVKAATVAARPFATVMPNVPQAIADVIDRALAFEKTKRWLTAGDMQTALREAARQSFEAVPTAAVMSELLDEIDEHEKTVILAETEPPPVEGLGGLVPHIALPPSDPLPDNGLPTPRKVEAGTLVGISPTSVEPRARTRDDRNASPPAIALITASAVATDSFTRRTPKSRGVMAAAVLLGAFGIGAVVFVATRGGSSKGSPVAASVSGPRTTAALSVSTLPSGALASPPGAWTPVAAPPLPSAPVAPTLPLVPVGALPPSHAAPKSLASPSTATGIAPASPPTIPTPVPLATPAPPPAAAAHKPDCNPPYEFDEGGNKRWKRECL